MPEDTPAQAIAKKMMARFPIIHPPIPDQNVGGGSYDVGVKDYRLSLNKIAPNDDQIGRYDAIIHLHCGETWVGFQGGVYYQFRDERGNVVYALLGSPYGMNPTSMSAAAPTEGDKQETGFIPVDILTAIYSVEILPVRMEGDPLDKLQQNIEQLAKGADIIRDGLKKIGASVAEIAAAIKAL